MTEPVIFDGHQVADVREGIFAVISHYVNPIIGRARLDAVVGRPYNQSAHVDALGKAADAILAALTAHEEG